MPQRPLNRPTGGRPSYGRRSDPLMPLGYHLSPGSNEFWTSWSQRRKIRFVRTMAIVGVIVLLLGRCALNRTGGEDTPTTTTTTTEPVTTTTISGTPTAVAAVDAPGGLPQARYIAGAASVGDAVLVVAGLDNSKNSTASIYRYNAADGQSAEVGSLPGPLHAAATTNLGDRALVMGGAKGDSVYNAVYSIDADGNVAEAGKLPNARAGATATTTSDGTTAYVVGGYDGTTGSMEVLRTTDGATFETVATLLHAVRYPAVTILDDTIWVIGGEFDNAILANIQRIDLTNGTVTDLTPLAVPTSRASAMTVGNSVFLIGGRTPAGPSGQILRYEPFNNGFVVAGSLPVGRMDAAIVKYENKAWLVGGQTPAPTNTIVELTAQ